MSIFVGAMTSEKLPVIFIMASESNVRILKMYENIHCAMLSKTNIIVENGKNG